MINTEDIRIVVPPGQRPRCLSCGTAMTSSRKKQRDYWECKGCGRNYEQIKIKLIFPKMDEKDESDLI